ncbi:hypothetical protein LTR66_017326, partial [Elasticomyces elasticus]
MAVEALQKDLKEDPKEILEHVLSVKATVEELSQLCRPGTVAIEDFMSVRTCGPVQHLSSCVTGILADDKDMWNAFDVLFPSITASGIPKQAAINAIQRLEARPRELYSAAVIMIDGPDSFEAALVLRTVFQQPGRQWIQAGAGIISQSGPEREFTETCEKLASIGPFVVPIVNAFNGASPIKDRIDPIRLTTSNIVPIFNLPLSQKVLGHESNESLAQVASGDISYTNFVAEQARSILQANDDQSTEQKQSQLLHLGLAALFAFLQSNVTGPPLEFNSAQVVLPSSLRTERQTLKAVRAKIIRDLSVDGEAAYRLTPNPELFSVAKALLADAATEGPLCAKTARMRANFLHQKMLSEVTSTLQDVIYKDVEVLDKAELNADERGRYLLERAIINTHHGFDIKAREDIDQAAKVRKFEFALTGKMGKRTKFQDRDISQLVVLAKSADETALSGEPSGPKNLDLNDDTLLESISFSDSKPDEESLAIQYKVSASLESIDANNQPILNPVDSALLLALASAITNTSPENGLTREETNPYATRVLDGGSSNWQIYTQALLVRSRVEGYRSRTVERAVLQMQALVDQVIADTATSDDAAQTESGEPSTFLPRPEQS